MTISTKADRLQKNLRVAQRAMERAMLEITKRDRIPNITPDKELKLRNILKHITTLKWWWVGHMARTSNDRWTKRRIE